jgi:hypothetical protein
LDHWTYFLIQYDNLLILCPPCDLIHSKNITPLIWLNFQKLLPPFSPHSKTSITATQLTLVKNQEAKKWWHYRKKKKGFICKHPSAIQEGGGGV